MAEGSILALHAHFDEHTETLLKRLQEQVASLNVDVERAPEEVRPHMTLGSWRVTQLAPGTVEKAVIALSSMPCMKVRLVLQLGVGPAARISLAPIVQHDLLIWHEHVHAAFPGPGKPYRTHDFPGAWVPHVSVFRCQENDLPLAYHALKIIPFPLSASISGLGFIMYGEGAIKSIASVSLKA